MRDLTESHKDLIRVSKTEYDHFLTLSDVTYDNFNVIRNIVCDNFQLNLETEARLMTENIISQYVSTTQNEIFHILSNRVPDTFDFYKDFDRFCTDVNGDLEFCKKLSFSSMIEFTQSKLFLEKETHALILRTKVRMPILAEDFPSKTLSLYRSLNIGYFDENGNLAKLMLPKTVIKSDEIVYGMSEPCQQGICYMNGLTRNTHSICAENVFKGNVDNCQVEISHEKQICDFTQVPGLGTIVTASYARYSEKSDDLISLSRVINDSTVFFENDGQLECLRSTGPSYHKLVTHRAAKFSLRVPEIRNLDVNLSQMTVLNNNQEMFNEIVTDLKTFHENEYFMLGKFSVSDDSILCYSALSFILLLIVLLFYLFNRTRKVLNTLPTSVLKTLK